MRVSERFVERPLSSVDFHARRSLPPVDLTSVGSPIAHTSRATLSLSRYPYTTESTSASREEKDMAIVWGWGIAQAEAVGL